MSYATNEPRVRVELGGRRFYYASLTAAQVLKNEHARNREIHPGPTANKSAKPLRMTELAGEVMTNEINRQCSCRGRRPIGVGERFGRLLVLSLNLRSGVPLRWNVVCDCGVEKLVLGKHLQEGGTRSCGCLRRENARKRGKVRGKAMGKANLGKRWQWKARKAAA